MTIPEVVITQFGFISPLGHTEEVMTDNLFAGKSGVRPLSETDLAPNFPVPYAAFIPHHEIPISNYFKKNKIEHPLKSWLLTAAATDSLLNQSTKDFNVDAIIYGTADGVSFEMAFDILKNKNIQNFDFEKTRCESSLNILMDILKENGHPEVLPENLICLNSACATGNNAIGLAYEGLQAGRWTRCLVGGVDARCEPSNYLNFFSLGALTTSPVPCQEASRPFSVDRSGFVRGEGSALLLMETLDSALQRGAQILAKVNGFGFTSDAFRLTDGRDDGESVIKAMELALMTANIQPSMISYINAHGTSTPLNDRLETQAIKQVFKEMAYQIPVSSLKSQIGHATIAASALEAIACILMIKNQKIAPTINFKGGDPDCDLDYVPNFSREHKIDYILSNSFGFGGQNACVIFGKA